METFRISSFGGLDESLTDDGDSKLTTDLDGVEVRRGRVIGCRGITPLSALSGFDDGAEGGFG